MATLSSYVQGTDQEANPALVLAINDRIQIANAAATYATSADSLALSIALG